MSGLTAALELSSWHTVIVVEAQARPGGRVATMRDETDRRLQKLVPGAFPKRNTWAMSYVTAMGLETGSRSTDVSH